MTEKLVEMCLSVDGRSRCSSEEMRRAIQAIQKRHDGKLKELKNLSTPMAQSAVYLDRWVQQNFKQEGSPVGGWRSIQREGMILQDTGRLRASFSPFHTRYDAGIGSDLSYSEVHNEGIGAVKKRRILPRRTEVMDDIRKIIRNFINRVIK